MGKVFLDMSMSLDGFIAGPKGGDNQDRELEGLDRVTDWMFSGKTEREAEEWQEAYFTTIGAIIIGRRTFDLGVGPWGDNPTYHAPCFVLSTDAQEKIVKQGGTSYTFVTDGIESALEKAKAAAGNKDVRVLGGANAAQQYMKAGLLDEVQIHLAPVLLGEGIRLFEHLGSEPIKLATTRVIEVPGATHLIFRVVK